MRLDFKKVIFRFFGAPPAVAWGQEGRRKRRGVMWKWFLEGQTESWGWRKEEEEDKKEKTEVHRNGWAKD